MTDKELLSAAIKASGKSVRGFARDVLTRDARTVWRWLAGPQYDPETGELLSTAALPWSVRLKCEAILAQAKAEP